MFDSDFALALLERMGGNSATLVLDKNGTCIFASSSAAGVLGITKEELISKNFVDSFNWMTLEGEEVLEEKHPVVRTLEFKDYVQTTPFFFRLPTANLSAATQPAIEPTNEVATETPTFALTTIPIHKDGLVNYVVVQVRKAKREVQIGEMKSLFVSFAAHQLKTPSSVVKGFLELMMRQGEEAYSPDQWHFLISAFESNENLIAISKSLLNMARLEGGLIEPSIRNFEPNRALQSKIASFAPIYGTKRIRVNLTSSDNEEGTHLNSDENFFMEIFVILLGNAIKHSPIGSEIQVVCKLSKTACEVHVIDNGPGIPQAVREKLFNKGQDTTEDSNSHGLGLFMAKKYIALLGGTIGLAPSSSEGNTGSDFYFSVPNVDSDRENTA